MSGMPSWIRRTRASSTGEPRVTRTSSSGGVTPAYRLKARRCLTGRVQRPWTGRRSSRPSIERRQPGPPATINWPPCSIQCRRAERWSGVRRSEEAWRMTRASSAWRPRGSAGRSAGVSCATATGLPPRRTAPRPLGTMPSSAITPTRKSLGLSIRSGSRRVERSWSPARRVKRSSPVLDRAGKLEGDELPRAGGKLDALGVDGGLVAGPGRQANLAVQGRSFVGDDGADGEPAAGLAEAVEAGPDFGEEGGSPSSFAGMCGTGVGGVPGPGAWYTVASGSSGAARTAGVSPGSRTRSTATNPHRPQCQRHRATPTTVPGFPCPRTKKCPIIGTEANVVNGGCMWGTGG